MTTFLPNRLAVCKSIYLVLLFAASGYTGLAQNFRGKDGAQTYSLGTNILNRYTTLAASQSSGSLTITVTDITQLNGSAIGLNFVNPYATDALSKGDLIMIIQVQGADIATADDATYGAITNYNNTGNYELKTVFAVSGNTISLCQNLTKSYSQGGRARTQVIRVPRLTTLSVGPMASITGQAWSGTTGGVVAIETSGDISVDGNINADALGFRGGVDDKTTSATSGSAALLLYRTTLTTTTAGKGEGIAGNASDYLAYLNGANGRGAAANGGGGGNGHNSGGGGGSNAGTNNVLTPWNGTGIKSAATAAWTSAWNLEAANFANDISVGGGRGGYSYSNSNQDALVSGPGNAAWGGDKRNIVGGFGGRPLDFHGNTKAFLGGGGGAGDGNNSSAGNGGNGGGIVYLFSTGNISGTGRISANGQVGYNTVLTNIDAAGGGGGGGSVIANMTGTITGLSMQANGAAGGNQLTLLSEAEGPGGGGGGGYIATPNTACTRQVLGGDNGTSSSAQITEFLPNGATQGASGTIINRTFVDVFYCDAVGTVLPVRLQSFTAIMKNNVSALTWVSETEENASYFQVERSIDGENFHSIGTVKAEGKNKSTYSFLDNATATTSIIYYRLKMVDVDTKYSYSEIRIIKLGKQNTAVQLSTFPNPVGSDLRITLSSNWQGKQVRFELYDMSGRVAKRQNAAVASQTETINLQGLGAGVYILRGTSNMETMQERIVKN